VAEEQQVVSLTRESESLIIDTTSLNESIACQQQGEEARYERVSVAPLTGFERL